MLRGVLVVFVGRKLCVVLLNAGLAEAAAPVLPGTGLLSVFALDANVDLRLGDDAAVVAGRAGDLAAVVPDADCRFIAGLAEDFDFSSEPLTSLFLLSSTEPMEDLDL